MKRSLLIIVQIVFWLICGLSTINMSYSQELVQNWFNTPEVTRLTDEIKLMEKRTEDIRQKHSRLRAEIKELRKQERGDTFSDGYIKKLRESAALHDSVLRQEDKTESLRNARASEIVKNEEPQRVLKEMQTAVKSGDPKTSNKVLDEYRLLLLKQATENKYLEKINKETYKAEIKAINDLINVLSHLTYLPKRIVSRIQ